MRVTSWNCSRGADVSRRLSLLAPLRSDLITLQECRRPAIDSASVIWRGTDPRQGVAVVSTEVALPLEFIETPSLHPTVVPVLVQTPQPSVCIWYGSDDGCSGRVAAHDYGLVERRWSDASNTCYYRPH